MDYLERIQENNSGVYSLSDDRNCTETRERKSELIRSWEFASGLSEEVDSYLEETARKVEISHKD